MSVCAITNRKILYDIVNMDDQNAKISVDNMSGGKNRICDAKGVKADQRTPAAPSFPAATQLPRSTGGCINAPNCLNGKNIKKNCPKSSLIKAAKNESGSGSGDQDACHHEDGSDVAAKKRKTRRGKPKNRKLKPYSKQQLTYQQQMRSRMIGRLTKTGMQPPAPYNTTQFLMDDHNDLPDLEQKLSEAVSSEIPTHYKPVPPRTRDSSFSVDSDEDYFYSSPEDEEEFLTKEFSSAYEDVHAERLGSLSKSELIQEYIQLEAKVDLLTKRLRGKNFHQVEERETENKHSTTTDSEVAKKLKICQQRIDDLIQQNEQLRRENEALRAQRSQSPMSSMDSESDSESTSNGNHSTCSCEGTSPYSSPKCVNYMNKRDNTEKKKETSSYNNSNSDSSESENSSRTETTAPTNFVNGHVTTHEIDTSPT